MSICPAWRPVLYDDLSCMTTCPAWRPVLHDYMSCMTTSPVWRPVLHDDLSCITTCPVWRPVLQNDMSCMTNCHTWRSVMHDALSCMTACPAWRSVLHDGLSCMTTCPAWRHVMHDDVSCMAVCPARRSVLHNYLSCMTTCPAWRHVMHNDISCMTTCPAWRSVLHDNLSCMTTRPVPLFGSHFCWCFTHRRESRQINFLAAFHHDGKSSPGWWGWGCTTSPFHSIYHHEQSCGAPAERTCDTFGGFIKGILRGVRCTKSLRVLFLHRRPPSWTTLVLYSRAVFIFNEPAFFLLCGVIHMLDVLYSYCTYAQILTNYSSTDIGKSEFLAVKLNFNLFDFHYIFPSLNTTLQSYWKVHIKDLVGAAT